MDTGDKAVYIVDDDEAVRKALKRSLDQRGYRVKTYGSAEEFLNSYEHTAPGCLLLDVRMPGINGLEMQEILTERKIPLPIIFITGHGDIPMSVRAMKGGAVDFLEKPYPVEFLIERVENAFNTAGEMHDSALREAHITTCFEQLTPRERDVMIRLVAGAADTSNKVIARELEISHRTVDDHRARVMAKMQARSLAELVQMAKVCGVYRAEV
jgi:FixJ family two-component response regulator